MKLDNKQSVLSLRFASVLLVIALSGVLVNLPKVQGTEASVVGLWHLDEVEPADYMEITPDAMGYNHGTLGGEPPPALVEGKFGKALRFEISSFVYVPIAFLVGFPPTPEPIYIPVSSNLDIQKELKVEVLSQLANVTLLFSVPA